MEQVLPFAGRLTHDGQPIGSGFVVHASGLVATCWHVVRAVGAGSLEFATLDGRHVFPVDLAGEPDLRHDLVLLRPRTGIRLPALTTARLLTGNSTSSGDAFVLQGFGTVDDPAHAYDFLTATGRVVGPAQRDGILLIEIESRQVLRGMSGAGLLLAAHDGVVGVLTERYTPPPGQSWLRDTAWVVPAEHLAALSPDLLTAVPLRRTASPVRRGRPGPIWQTRGLQRAAVFAGRSRELGVLADLLTRERGATVVVAGVGGAGKTRLALEYAHRRAADYDVVWLARAEVLSADLRELAVALALAPEGDGDRGAELDGWLASHTRWLIVVDGADDLTAVRDRLPSGAGHVLITSRDAQWGNLAAVVRIEAVDRPSAVDYLRRRGLTAERTELDALAQSVGDLPLALEHAASFLLATGRTAQDYMTLLQERAAELLTETEATDYPLAITTTWSLSFERLRTESPAAMELLRLASFLAADDMPLALLATAAEELPQRLRGNLTDPLAMARTVGHLGRYSLAHPQPDAINVHPLVQTVVREVSLTPTERERYAARAVRIMRREFPSDSHDVEHWAVCARLSTHAITAAGHAEHLTTALDDASGVLDRVATYLEKRVNSRTAVPLFERAVALAEREMDSHSAVLATRLNNLAGAVFDTDDLQRAKDLFERVLTIDEYRGRRHREPMPASHLMNYGVTIYFLGQREEALEYMERAVHQADPSTSYFGTMLLNLASERRSQQDYGRAEALALLAQENAAQRVGTRHPSYAAALSERARIAADREDVARATALHRQATEIYAEQLGYDAPQTVEAYAKYFDALTDNGLQHEALELADWMRIHLDLSGPPRSSGTADNAGRDYSAPRVLAALGIAYLQAERAADALDCFYAVAAAIEEAWGPGSAGIALAENNIGSALLALGRTGEARFALEKAVRAARAVQDPLIAVYLANLAGADARSNDESAAEQHIAEALAEQRRHGTDLSYLLQKIAAAEAALGHIDAARTRLRHALGLLAAAPLPERHRQMRQEKLVHQLEALD